MLKPLALITLSICLPIACMQPPPSKIVLYHARLNEQSKLIVEEKALRRFGVLIRQLQAEQRYHNQSAAQQPKPMSSQFLSEY